MSYGLARQFSPRGSKFGTGEVEGVVAPSTAAHAAGIGALLPMVTLGIPGSPTAAVMLAGFFIWGLNPGPLLFQENREFVWGLIGSMYLANVIGVLIVLTLVPAFAAIVRIPFAILAPLIVILCSIGAYAVNNQVLDLWIMLGAGLAGYLFKKLGYPLAPLVVALVLGDMTEQAFRQSLIMGQSSPAIFFTRPISALFIALAVTVFLVPFARPLARRLRGEVTVSAEASAGSQGDNGLGVVAFTRELGSLGTFIAEELARRRGYRLVRREILEEAARTSPLTEDALARLVESPPTLWERVTLPARRHFYHVAARVLEFAQADDVLSSVDGPPCFSAASDTRCAYGYARPYPCGWSAWRTGWGFPGRRPRPWRSATTKGCAPASASSSTWTGRIATCTIW